MPLIEYERNLIKNSLGISVGENYKEPYKSLMVNELKRNAKVSMSAVLSSFLGPDSHIFKHKHRSDYDKDKEVINDVNIVESVTRSFNKTFDKFDIKAILAEDNREIHIENNMNVIKDNISQLIKDNDFSVEGIDDDNRLYLPPQVIEGRFDTIFRESRKENRASGTTRIEFYELEFNPIYRTGTKNLEGYMSLFFIVLRMKDKNWEKNIPPKIFKDENIDEHKLLFDHVLIVPNKSGSHKFASIVKLLGPLSTDWADLPQEMSFRNNMNLSIKIDSSAEGTDVTFNNAFDKKCFIKIGHDETIHLIVFDNRSKEKQKT